MNCYGAKEPFLHRDRTAYFDGIPKQDLDDAVVFLDPDNGLEVKSTRKGNGNKYVTYDDDMASIYGGMGEASILVIYQHLPRLSRRFSLYGKFNKLVEKLGCLIPAAISNNQIAFIILAKDSKRQLRVREALHEYMRSHPHLQIYV